MKPILIEYIDENGTTWDYKTYMDGLTDAKLLSEVSKVKITRTPKKVLVIEKEEDGTFTIKEM